MDKGADRFAREGMKAKDWIAIIISLFALLISATTAYFGVVLQREWFEATILDWPRLKYANETFKPLGPVQFVFVNRGTLGIVVSGAVMTFTQSENEIEEPCARDFFDDREMKIEAFIVKPADVVIKTISFDQAPFGLKGPHLNQQKNLSLAIQVS